MLLVRGRWLGLGGHAVGKIMLAGKVAAGGGRRWRCCWCGFSHVGVSSGSIRFCGGVGNYNRHNEFSVGFGSNSALDSSTWALSLLKSERLKQQKHNLATVAYEGGAEAGWAVPTLHSWHLRLLCLRPPRGRRWRTCRPAKSVWRRRPRNRPPGKIPAL